MDPQPVAAREIHPRRAAYAGECAWEGMRVRLSTGAGHSGRAG